MTRNIRTDSFSFDTATGLSAEQVQNSRKKYGPNELTPPKRTAWWKDLLAKFDDPTIRILLFAAALSLAVTAIERYALGNGEAGFLDSLGIFFAVLLATLVGFLSERKSAREFELLNRVKEEIEVKTLRDGQFGAERIDRVVVGDLVRIDPGDKIPADGVLVESTGLYIDQAMLTGESVPARKKDFSGELVLEKLIEATRPGDEWFAARGTMAVDGHGLLLVTAVGDRTEIGGIARSLSDVDPTKSKTPLTAKLSVLAKQISVVGVIGAMTIFSVMALVAVWKSPLLPQLFHSTPAAVTLGALSLLVGGLTTRFALLPFFKRMSMETRTLGPKLLAALPMAVAAFAILLGVWGTLVTLDWFDEGIALLNEILLAFVVAVTIIVVAVPEGLPMMVTVSLALNMMKMARENCLVRKLIASETIGAATVICTDKTGTLTENRMTPVRIFLGEKVYARKDFDQLAETSDWHALCEGIAVNSEANLHVAIDANGAETVTGVGNPTECALLKFLRERKFDYLNARKNAERLFELGHNSERKMSVVAVKDSDGFTCFVKGAPERILAGCSTLLINGKPEPIGPHLEQIEQTLTAASNDALRVLALSEIRRAPQSCAVCAHREGSACAKCGERCFVGWVGIADPVRSEVPAAVETCRKAHVEVKMITGDAPATAVAIARGAGIYAGNPDELVLTSDELAAVPDESLPEVARKIRVLARSTPMDKLRLVKALHKTGEVVAMTGDGTNDAPALKYADVGLAMGVTGTEVAKEASDIVLVDDNFKSIVTGVWWGRTLFQNIQRFLQFQLSVNAVATACALIGPLVGVPLPLTVTQLLWINIIMDTFAAIALSTDPPRLRTMTERPIPRDAHIITPTMGISILTVSLYQVAILFAALFGGWFVDPEHIYDFTIPATDPNYLDHNLPSLTIFFTILVMFQFWHKINCRALRHDESPFALLSKNRLFLIIVGTITVVQIIMVQTPFLGHFFRTAPLSLRQWCDIALLTVTVVPVAWLGRRIAYYLGLEKAA